eukprot:s662_g5.t1
MFEDTRRGHFLCLADWWPEESDGSMSQMSLWPFGCNCGATEVVSPPGSPSRRGRSSAHTLLARGRESSVPGPSKGTVEVVQVATTDEMSDDTQQVSSSSLDPKSHVDVTRSPVLEVDLLDNNGSRSVKNTVRWEVEVMGSSPKSQKSQKSLEKAERTQKKRKTLHTWLSAMLDVSEGGFDTVTVPEGGSPASFAHSRSRTLHPPSLGASGQPSILWLLRDHFVNNVDADGSGHLSRDDLFEHIKDAAGRDAWDPWDGRCGGLPLDTMDYDGMAHAVIQPVGPVEGTWLQENLEEDEGTLNAEDLELLREVERCRFSEMDLGLGGEDLGMAEWLHFMLLRASAPSHVAAKHLNRHLRKALEDKMSLWLLGNKSSHHGISWGYNGGEDLELLGRIHAAFEYADCQGDGLIRQEKWPEAFEVVGLGQPPDEILEDREEDGSPWALSYYEFVAHALGLKAAVVELALYDLSQGVAQWVPSSLLGGHKLDGVWHSGLRVFGKEFWYGGVILESNYSDVPFGEPAAVIRLGSTLRSHEDLVEFLKEDVYVDYNPRMYDVLRRNCNHFSNELAQFLLHGKQLPEDVLMQPEWLKDVSADSTPQAVSRIDDLTEEWRFRLQANDLVMHRTRFIDRPRAVRIVSIGNDENGSRVAEVKFFKPSAADGLPSARALPSFSWEVVRMSAVPLRQFYPLLQDPVAEEHGCAHILRAGLAIRDDAARAVLQRPRSVRVQPQCTKGHLLKPEEAKWFSFVQPKTCTVCRSVVGMHEVTHTCAQCDFVLCSSCRHSAAQLPCGGAFSDVLSPDLARALLGNEENFDKPKARRVDNRLAAELGVKPLGDSELIQALKEASGALELSESAFQHFFSTAVTRALARLEAGKLWRPKRRGSRR